jgi:hypothetical protein
LNNDRPLMYAVVSALAVIGCIAVCVILFYEYLS